MIERAVRRRPAEEGESYFMSMTDMMVGLLLIFIILLTYFALNLQTRTAELNTKKTRDEILVDLRQSLKDKGLPVQIDTDTGVLRLPEEVLFGKGEFTLTVKGESAVEKVANAMVEVLPCYTSSDLCRGERKPHLIDAVFVEGHTDTDPMVGAMSNYGLSARRAEVTFNRLREVRKELDGFRNAPEGTPGAAPILGLSGYGPDRPIDRGDDEEAKKLNRRIDLRFLMQAPGSQRLDEDILRRR